MRFLRPFAGAAFAVAAALALSAAPVQAQTKFTFDTIGPWHSQLNDFDDYDPTDWVLTTTEAGSGSATEAVGNIGGGILVVTNDNADDDKDAFQWSGRDKSTTAETFTFSTTKKLYFAARFKISDATQSDFAIGLETTDTTPLAVSDGIWFGKDDGDTHLDFHVAASSTQTNATDIAEIADDTYVKIAFYYPGSGDKIKLLVNDVEVGSAAITNAPTVSLTLSFAVQNGEAVAKVMSVDYLAVYRERS